MLRAGSGLGVGESVGSGYWDRVGVGSGFMVLGRV